MENNADWQMPRYTDSTLVREGDAIRYKQAPGGILPASQEWMHGVAVPSTRFGYPSLVLEAHGLRYNLTGHIIERA